TPALQSRGKLFVDEADGHLDADARGRADALKIDVQRGVLDGIELYLARDHAQLFAVHIELEDGGEEPAAREQEAELAIIDGNRRGFLPIAIENAGDGALAADGACAALARARTCGSLDLAELLDHGSRAPFSGGPC